MHRSRCGLIRPLLIAGSGVPGHGVHGRRRLQQVRAQQRAPAERERVERRADAAAWELSLNGGRSRPLLPCPLGGAWAPPR